MKSVLTIATFIVLLVLVFLVTILPKIIFCLWEWEFELEDYIEAIAEVCKKTMNRS